MDAYLSILRRRLREIRVSLVAFQVELGGGQIGEATASRTLSEPTLEQGQISPLADAPTLMLPDQDDPANKEHEGVVKRSIVVFPPVLPVIFHAQHGVICMNIGTDC